MTIRPVGQFTMQRYDAAHFTLGHLFLEHDMAAALSDLHKPQVLQYANNLLP